MHENPQTLDDACEFIVDCLHKTAPVLGGGYPSIRTPNVGRGRLLLQGVNRVSQETYNEWTRRAVPRENDLILAREAPAGNVAIIKNGQTVCLGQRTVHLRPDPNRVDPDFLCYFLLAPPQQGVLLAGETGATAGHVNMRDIRRLPLVGLTDQTVQRKAGAILAAYDDLIENNRRRMALLEEAARQLYREWFVRLRFPGHEHIKIIDGLPDGWEAYKLGDLLTKIKRSGKVKKEDYLEEGLIPCVDQSQSFIGGYTEDEEAKITSPLPLVVFGDHTRALKFIDFPFACGADGTQLLYPKDDRLSIQYFYFAVGNIDLSNYFYARHFKFLKDQNLLVPTANLMAEFTDFSIDNLKQISTLREANHNLARARDLLLPRLMSGEITG